MNSLIEGMGVVKSGGNSNLIGIILSALVAALLPALAVAASNSEIEADPFLSQQGQYECQVIYEFGFPGRDSFLFYHEGRFVQATWLNNDQVMDHFIGTVKLAQSDLFVRRVQDFTGRRAFGFRFLTSNLGSEAVARAILFFNDPRNQIKGELVVTEKVPPSDDPRAPLEKIVYSRDLRCKSFSSPSLQYESI